MTFLVVQAENFQEQRNICKGSPVFSGRDIPNRTSCSISSKSSLIPVSGLRGRFPVNGIGHFRVPRNFALQNEAKYETFVVKMSFICIIIKDHFHINGFALSLALKVRFFGTRKWHIEIFQS